MANLVHTFSYTGNFLPTTGGAFLQMNNGILADVGYTIPRSYYVLSMAVSWRGGSLPGGNFRVILTNDNVDIGLQAEITASDIANGYKIVSATSNISIIVNEHLGCYAETDNSADYLTDLMAVAELSSVAVTASDDDVLGNITVLTADLARIKPNIAQYLMDGETDFSEIILNEKRKLYSEIKLMERGNYPGYTNAELDTLLDKIKDLTKEQNLRTRLCYQVVGWILFYNRLYDEADYFIQHSKSVPLQYYIDDDSDSVTDESERSLLQMPRFGR